jgi:CHASE3 domain sensor protein
MSIMGIKHWVTRIPRDSASLATAIPLSIVIMVGALLSLRSHYLLSHDRELVVHSFEVMRAADQVLIGALDAETGQLGFVITGNPDFLRPYQQATRQAIPGALTQLLSLAGDNTQQLKQIYELKELTDAKLEELNSTVLARRTQGFATSQALVAERSGKQTMDRIRTVTQHVKQSEEQLLSARSVEVRRDEQRIIVIIVLTTLLSTLLRIGIASWRQRTGDYFKRFAKT